MATIRSTSTVAFTVSGQLQVLALEVIVATGAGAGLPMASGLRVTLIGDAAAAGGGRLTCAASAVRGGTGSGILRIGLGSCIELSLAGRAGRLGDAVGLERGGLGEGSTAGRGRAGCTFDCGLLALPLLAGAAGASLGDGSGAAAGTGPGGGVLSASGPW